VKLHMMSDGPDAPEPDAADATDERAAKTKFAQVTPIVRRMPKPAAAGGMAALVAMAAIIAVKRRHR